MLTLAFCPGFPWTLPYVRGRVAHTVMGTKQRAQHPSCGGHSKASPEVKLSPQMATLQQPVAFLEPAEQGQGLLDSTRSVAWAFHSQSLLLLAVKMRSAQGCSCFHLVSQGVSVALSW